jgi:hypothetical protein
LELFDYSSAGAGGFWACGRVYNIDEMSATLVRRILYGGMAAWVFVMAVEEFRLQGHMGTAIAFSVAGIVLLAIAITGKGG